MRKILLMAAAVSVAFTSCVKNDQFSTNADSKEITFEVAKYKAQSTRAEVAFPTDIPFGAYAYYQTHENPGVHSMFIDNAEIIYKTTAGNGYWAANGETYYWPVNGHLDFISYAPYNADATSAAVPKISDDDAQQTLKYTGFKVDADAPVDLLYSDKAMQQTTNTVHYGFTGVPTLFHHALAKLNIKVKAFRMNNAEESPEAVTSWVVKVKSISLINIYDEGNLTLKTTNVHDAGATTVQWTNDRPIDGHNVWSNSSSMISKEWVCDQILTTSATTYGQGTSDVATNYFVLPQDLVDGVQQIKVVYEITTTAPGGQSGTTEYTAVKDLTLASTAVQAWECGKNITYTIDIDPAGDEIHFAPAIVDWEDVDGVISI